MVDTSPINEVPTPPQGDGARLAKLLEPGDPLRAYIPSLRPTERLRNLPKIDGIILVGPKKSGKHPLLSALEGKAQYDPALKGRVNFPQRWTTRQLREGDRDRSIPEPGRFEEYVKSGEIDFYWAQPPSEEERAVSYGFKIPKSGIPIYLGSSSFVSNPDSVTPHDMLDRLLVIGLNVPFEERRERLFEEFPHLRDHTPDEVTRRLIGSDEKIQAGSHIIVDNYGSLRDYVPSNLVNLVKAVTGLKTPPSSPL